MAAEVQNNEQDIEKMNLMIDAIFDDNFEAVARLIEEEGFDVNTRNCATACDFLNNVTHGLQCRNDMCYNIVMLSHCKQ